MADWKDIPKPVPEWIYSANWKVVRQFEDFWPNGPKGGFAKPKDFGMKQDANGKWIDSDGKKWGLNAKGDNWIKEGIVKESSLKRFKVFIDGEKEPLILTGKNENDVKKFAHQMIRNNKVKITKVTKESITESLKGKFVVASIYGDLYTPTAVGEKEALKLMLKLAKQYAGDNVFTLGAEYWNKPHKFNKKKIMVKEGKLTEGKLNEFNKAHFLNLIQQELDSIKGQKAYVKDKLRDKDLEKWEKKEWNQVWPELVKREKELKIRINNVKQMKEGKLTEGKWKMKGKYLNMPDGGESSIPGNYDRDAIVVGIKNDTFKIYMNQGKLYTAGDRYDKTFKNGNDLANWLNKNKAQYYGIDRR
jgi:hypothetical protein